MSAVQRPKRKAANRMTFDDADATAPAKKKSKVQDEEPQTKAGRANGAAAKKSAVYEEQVDGFTFSRSTRVKKAPSKDTETTTQAEPAPSRSTRRKRESEESAPTRRRSKRLSGDKEQEPAPTTSKTTKVSKSKPAQENKDGSPEVPVTKLAVGKKRDVTTITLPFADTPVMNRNKKMRATQGRVSSGHRRSSAGIRGRRASSLIESGTSHAVPHADVPVSEFYKLIENDLLEPKRMRQLLTWCASRALLEKPKPTAQTSTIENIAIESARQIQDELLKDFAAKNEFSDWWSRTDSAASSLPKKPNPRNVRNADKLKELEEEINRLEAEESTWESLLSKPDPEKKSSELSTSPINASLLSPSQQALLSLIPSASTTSTASTISARLSAITSTLEPTVDSLADGVHALSQYSSAASKVAKRVTGVWAARLQAREDKAKRDIGGANVGTRDVLRALAGTLNDGK